MKRIFLCGMILLLLCGCSGWSEATYVVVEPHDEDYGTEINSDTLTVSSYLSLKNALLNMIEESATEGVIRAESYSGSLSEELSRAVNEITESTPIGAYAVSSMTYDYSRIVSYYEIHINISYQHTQEELAAITYVTDTDAVRAALQDAMENYSSRLVLQIGSYTSFDLDAAVEEIYLTYPEFVLELPETSMELYPETGSQRIMEIKFSYTHTAQELSEYQEILAEKLESLTWVYGNSSTDMTKAKRLYKRIGRSGELEQLQTGTHSLTGSAYGALIDGYATCYGYAQAYRLLMENCGVSCEIVTGWKNGATHYWCLAELDGDYYYIDPSLAVSGQGTDDFLMGDDELEENGYVINGGDYPKVTLPSYMKESRDADDNEVINENELEDSDDIVVSETTEP